MDNVRETPAGDRNSRGPYGPEILVSQNAWKLKDKDNLGGVPKIKLYKKSETKGGIVFQRFHFPIFG